MSEHDRVSELLGAYALDAVDLDESLVVELHVASCDLCRDELDQHLETAGAIGTVVEPLPDDLWSRIATQLPATAAVALGATVTDIHSRTRRSRTVPTWLGVAAAVVAVAILAVSLNNANANVSRLRSQALASGFARSWSAALATPGHYRVALRTASGSKVADVLVEPSGAAFLSSHTMPALATGRTYQLWVVSHAGAISIGLMGQHPTNVSFAVGTVSRGDTIAVTEEPSSGSVVPSSAPVASGVVRA